MNTFDRLNYQQTKLEIIDLIKQSHAWETNEGFLSDGIICPEIYEKEKLKVLVLLAESYGFSTCKEVDIERQPTEDVLAVGEPKAQTPKKIATLLWLLFKSIENGQAVEWNDFPDLLQINEYTYKELQATLSKIAWINVKKASKPIDSESNTSTHLDYQEIYESGSRNKNILELQIKSIAPDLIMVCSNPVIQSLYDNKIIGDEIDIDNKFTVQTNSMGQKLICLNHPGHLASWSYKGIYKTFQTIYNSWSYKTDMVSIE